MPALQLTYGASAVITANTAPTQGNLNRYDASGGALSITLPALSGVDDGANFLIEKYVGDTGLNAVTFTRSGSDTFVNASTSFTLDRPGQRAWLQVVTVSSTKYWAVILAGETNPRGGLTAITAQSALNTSTTLTTIATTNLPAASLFAGATYRIKLLGTVKVTSTSGTLTFTPYLQNTALNTIQMASQTSAEGPVGFALEIMVTVRTVGASGTAIAHGWGHIRFATNTALILASTNTTATTVDTTSAAASTALAVKAQWATSNANNALAIEVATIERVL
jgi:hypothetical protein